MVKSRDTMLIGVLALTVGTLTYLATNSLFGTDKLSTRVEVIEPISSEFDYLEKPYFTNNPLNPTRDITINENNNAAPLTQ